MSGAARLARRFFGLKQAMSSFPSGPACGASEATSSPASRIASFYDESYYRGHYGAVLADPDNYRLLSLYWREVLFAQQGLDSRSNVLDFGSGVGQVSAALPNSICFDFNRFAQDELRRRGRAIIERREDIPRAAFDCLLSSHSLEHSPSPADDLREFRQYMKPSGRLVLVLPVEKDLRPRLQADANQHFQCWTFQTITNLLLLTGWRPTMQRAVYGPYMLRTAGKYLSDKRAVRLAMWMGSWKRGFESMLTVAELQNRTQASS
jgi:SAM-dependent methyltransferase